MATNSYTTDLKGNPDLLIREVHKRRPIWDLRSPAHHNRDIVQKLWTEIGEKLGLPLDIIKNKWKHLRDNFRTELKKTVRGTGNPPQPYQSQWMFFNDLLFLEEQMMKKISRLYQPYLSNDCNGDGEKDENNMMTNSTDFLTHSLFDDSSTAEPLAWWPQDDTNNVTHNLKNKRRRYNYDYESVTMTIMNDSSVSSKIKLHPNYDDIGDDDFHFMMSLLPFMKSLQPSRKMYLRTKLQEFICDFVYNIKCSNSSNNCQNVGINSDVRPYKASKISDNMNLVSNCTIKKEPG